MKANIVPTWHNPKVTIGKSCEQWKDRLLRSWNLATLCLFLCGLCSCVVCSWESTTPYWFLKVRYTVHGKTSMCRRVGSQKIPTQRDMWKHLAAQGVRTAHRRCWESKLCKGFCRICSWKKQTLGYQDGWQPSVRCHFYYFQRNLEAMARYFGGQLRNKNAIHRFMFADCTPKHWTCVTCDFL